MHRLFQTTPPHNLAWAVLVLVAATVLLASYISVLQGAVQRGEWRASHAQAGVWTTAQDDSRRDNLRGVASELRATDDVAVLLPGASR